jgi:hypothetical protein
MKLDTRSSVIGDNLVTLWDASEHGADEVLRSLLLNTGGGAGAPSSDRSNPAVAVAAATPEEKKYAIVELCSGLMNLLANNHQEKKPALDAVSGLIDKLQKIAA